MPPTPQPPKNIVSDSEICQSLKLANNGNMNNKGVARFLHIKLSRSRPMHQERVTF